MQDAGFRWNIPNVLTLYRIGTFPLLAWLIWTGDKQWFVILLMINQVTDILDGLLARLLNQRTAFGARLDAIADAGTYAIVLAGLFIFEWAFLAAHGFAIGLFFSFYMLVLGISYFRFGHIVGLHSYASKISGHAQAIFVFVLFLNGFIGWLYYAVLVASMYAVIEDILMISLISTPRNNVKGLYWVLAIEKTLRQQLSADKP